MILADLHAHLYGCFTGTELIDLARGERVDTDRLKWYASEYHKLTGRQVDPSSYFSAQSNLQGDYQKMNWRGFDEFQARINLAIALFPIDPLHPVLLNAAIRKHRQENQLGYVQYRLFLPPYFDNDQLANYVRFACQTCAEGSDRHFTAQLAFSIARQQPHCDRLINFLIQLLVQHPDLAAWVTGIDFCGYEQGFPPWEKAETFRRVRSESNLAILYHVGETLAGLHPCTMLRWIVESATLGAHRLGHATILGLKKSLLDCSADLKIADAATQQWWAKHGCSSAAWEDMQQAACQLVVDTGAIIEACPTSTMTIANLPCWQDLPIANFLDRGLPTVICSDDPGIFGCTLRSEFQLLRSQLGLADQQIQHLKQTALKLTPDRK